MILEKWKTKDGSFAEIDGLHSSGKVKVGTLTYDSKYSCRCIWDTNTGQSWAKEAWDLEEKLDAPPETTNK